MNYVAVDMSRHDNNYYHNNYYQTALCHGLSIGVLYYSVQYLIDLSLLSRYPFRGLLGQLLLLLFGVLLCHISKRIVRLIITSIKVIPHTIQPLHNNNTPRE